MDKKEEKERLRKYIQEVLAEKEERDAEERERRFEEKSKNNQAMYMSPFDIAKQRKEVFSHNLNYLMQEYDLNQKEMADKIGVSAQLFNTWVKKTSIPRTDRIQRIADIFGKTVGDLLMHKLDDEQYISRIAGENIKEIFKRKELRDLFDAANDCPVECIELATKMLLMFKEKNNKNN